MTPGIIRGTRVVPDRAKTDTKPCPRCGVQRKVDGGGRKRTGLCQDCSRSMSKEERDQWMK